MMSLDDKAFLAVNKAHDTKDKYLGQKINVWEYPHMVFFFVKSFLVTEKSPTPEEIHDFVSILGSLGAMTEEIKKNNPRYFPFLIDILEGRILMDSYLREKMTHLTELLNLNSFIKSFYPRYIEIKILFKKSKMKNFRLFWRTFYFHEKGMTQWVYIHNSSAYVSIPIGFMEDQVRAFDSILIRIQKEYVGYKLKVVESKHSSPDAPQNSVFDVQNQWSSFKFTKNTSTELVRKNKHKVLIIA
jgi:hypothetical protein